MARQRMPARTGRLGSIGAWFLRKQAAGGAVGLVLGGSEVQAAHVIAGSERPALERCDTWSTSATSLSEWVQQAGLGGARCVLVPPDDGCVLRVIDAPDLPRHEWIDSVRWQVQDLVDFDVGGAWIDVLDIPVAEDWTRARKIYVLIGEAQKLRTQIEVAKKAGLTPVGFEPRERALLRAAQPTEGTGGMAVLHLSPKNGLMVVGDGGEIYVTRPLQITEEFSAAEPFAPGEEGDAPSHPAFDALLLDLQRSLDYYETEFGRSPVSKVVLAGAEDDPSELAAFITASLRLPVEVLDLAAALPGSATPLSTAQSLCVDAFGAALSREPVFAHELVAKAKKTQAVGPGTVLRVSAAVAVGALLQWGLESHQAGNLEQQVDDLQVHRDRTSERLHRAAAATEPEPLSPQKRARLAILEGQRRRQMNLLETLSSQGEKRRSFASIQASLAGASIPGLWLTEIRLKSGGQHLELVGRTRSAALVPEWIEALEAEEPLAGVGFEALAIQRNEEGGLEFELRATAEEEERP